MFNEKRAAHNLSVQFGSLSAFNEHGVEWSYLKCISRGQYHTPAGDMFKEELMYTLIYEGAEKRDKSYSPFSIILLYTCTCSLHLRKYQNVGKLTLP